MRIEIKYMVLGSRSRIGTEDQIKIKSYISRDDTMIYRLCYLRIALVYPHAKRARKGSGI